VIRRTRPDKLKYQLSLGLYEAASLEELKRDTEASSRSEVIREALALYGFAVEATKRGGAVSIRHSDGSVAMVAVRGLEVVRRAFSSSGT